MPQTTINNGDTGLSVRNALNTMFNEAYTSFYKISASNILPATSTFSANTIVTRNSSGGFNAGNITTSSITTSADSSFNNIKIGTGTNGIGFGNLVINNGVTSLTTGNSNVIIGNNAGNFINGSENTGVGAGAFQLLGSGSGNTALGTYAGYLQSNSSWNTAIGWSTLGASTAQNSISNYNTAVGAQSMTSNETGYENAALGYNTLGANTTGYYNCAFGASSLNKCTIGFANVGAGYATLFNVTNGNHNAAFGYGAMNGSASSTSMTQNVALGSLALRVCTGNANVAVGYQALAGQTNPTGNIAIGMNSGVNISSGGGNTVIGYLATQACTTGTNNTALGYGAMNQGTGSATTDNTIVGAYAGINLNGSQNTAIGSFAANFGTVTSYNNCTALGYNAIPAGSNQVRIGNTAVTNVVSQVGNWSDERDKADIRDTQLGLDFITSLRPVDYKWDYREDYRSPQPSVELPVMPSAPIEPIADKHGVVSEEDQAKYLDELAKYNIKLEIYNQGLANYNNAMEGWALNNSLSALTFVKDGSKKRTRYHHGLIAQEVKQVLDQKGIDFGGYQDFKIKGGDDGLIICYMELIGPMIKAIQELNSEVASLKQQLANQ